MSVKQRLVEFAKFKERSVRQFEMNCGLTVGYINAIRVSVQPDKVNSIALYYPDLNTGWLLTGEGEMLKSSSDTSTNNNELLASLKKNIELQEEHISLLKEMLVIKDAEINRLKKALASAVPQTANVG